MEEVGEVTNKGKILMGSFYCILTQLGTSDILATAAPPWNNGKSGAKLDLTSSTTPVLQIHTVDHTRTANPCDWLPCHHATLPLVGCPHSTLLFIYISQLLWDLFSVSQQPPIWEPPPLFHGTGPRDLYIHILGCHCNISHSQSSY